MKRQQSHTWVWDSAHHLRLVDRGNLSFTDFLTIVLHPLKCLLKGRKHSIGGKALLTLCSCWRHRKCLFFVCFLIWSSLTFEVFVEYRNICFHPHCYWFKPSRNFTSKIDLFCPESLGRSRLVTSAAALTLLLITAVLSSRFLSWVASLSLWWFPWPPLFVWLRPMSYWEERSSHWS